MTFNLTWEPHGILVFLSGKVTREEFFDLHQRIYANPRIDEIHYVLYDTLAVTEVELAEDDLRAIAAKVFGGGRTRGGIRQAFAATACDAQSAARTFIQVSKMLGSNREFGIFSSLPEARAWAEAPPAP